MKNVNLQTLELFNCVLEKPADKPKFLKKYGVLVDATAVGSLSDVKKYLENNSLTGNQLNKTFHKSWKVIKDSTREELWIHQMLHYFTTYGTGFSSSFVYLPNEELNLPKQKVTVKVIRGISEKEIISKCINILESGIALKEETLNSVFNVLDALKYSFTGDENIKNKEAIIRLADVYGIYPKATTEFFRYLIFKATGSTLVIKNRSSIEAIKNSSFNPSMHLNRFGLEKMATVFNRYKPLFLAFKGKCPSVINKISKLSKKHHKPMSVDVLNLVTSGKVDEKALLKRLESATFFQIAKALQALYNRKNGQTNFVYRVRNGKSFAKEGIVSKGIKSNYKVIKKFLKEKYDLSDKIFFIPDNIEYALPTSEKMFVGNIPTGTKVFGDKLCAGVYWEDSWGARDLDLSGMGLNKVGWNSSYTGKGLLYSGDITSAPNGAVEYLHATDRLDVPTLVINNVYSGSPETGYQIIVGKGSKVSRDFMMNPNNRLFDVKCQSVQKQTILGMLLPETDKKKMSFVLLNFGSGSANVSGHGKVTDISRAALYQQYNKPYSLNKLIELCGGSIVSKETEDSVNLSPAQLEKDTLIDIFK